MQKESLLLKINQIFEEDQVLLDEPLSGHTTFRIGGPADIFLLPQNTDQIAAIRRLCKEENIPVFFIGNGSNLLVGDKGFRGVIVKLQKNMDRITVNEDCIVAEAGALLSTIAAQALAHSLTGWEFAAGIPGTVGGACVMNAGAYGGELSDVLVSIEVVTGDGEVKTIPSSELALGYRTSNILKNDNVVTGATIRLKKGEPAAIKARMEELKEARVSKQPLQYPSAGSTFKRPEGYFAGKLIQDAGLKGFCVGDACVSEKHSGFVINKGHASAAEVRELMQEVQDRVYKQFGVRLVPEVRFLGEF